MFEEFRDQMLRRAIEQTAAELEAQIRGQLPRGARVVYAWDGVHMQRVDVVEGECIDVTEQPALPPQQPA